MPFIKRCTTCKAFSISSTLGVKYRFSEIMATHFLSAGEIEIWTAKTVFRRADKSPSDLLPRRTFRPRGQLSRSEVKFQRHLHDARIARAGQFTEQRICRARDRIEEVRAIQRIEN